MGFSNRVDPGGFCTKWVDPGGFCSNRVDPGGGLFK